MIARTEPGRGVAFFDVDETLVDLKSMALFLDYAAEQLPGIPSWSRFLAGLDPCWDRSQGNAAYYEIWAGHRKDEVMALGRAWFDEARRQPGFFIPSTCARLRRHLRAGHDVVLVTGSFPAPILPIARHLDVTAVLASELDTFRGRYTGALVRSMIGPGKADAARLYLDGVLPEAGRTWAYGDHRSDLPLLAVADHRFLVAPDADTLATADGSVTVIGHDTVLGDPA